MTTETALRALHQQFVDSSAQWRKMAEVSHDEGRPYASGQAVAFSEAADDVFALVAALTPRADYGITLDPAEADGPTMPPNADELAPAQRLRSREHANRIIVKSGPPPPPEGPATWRPATSDWEDLRRWLLNAYDGGRLITALNVLVFMRSYEPDDYANARNEREPNMANPRAPTPTERG